MSEKALCRYCMRPTEHGDLAHWECMKLKGEGYSDAQIIAIAEGRSAPMPPSIRPLTFGRAVWAVILGNLLFSVAAALIYFITH